MSLLKKAEYCVRRIETYFVLERRKQYWTRLMEDNVASISQKTIGGGNLSGNQKESVKDLFRNTPAFSFIFHRFYTMATGIFSEKYMPDSLYYQYIDPYFNNWNMAKYLDHKGMYRNMFPGAKQPRLLAYRMNGFWYDENGKMIDIHKALAIIMKCKSCFIKQAVDSEGGHGVFFVNPKQHTIDSINDLLNQTTIDIVVQEGLVQSDTLSAINKNSVNTIRLLTLLRLDGTVKIYSVVLRMGIGDAKVDNASSGGITVGVEDNGRLKSCAYSAKGMRFDIHPTSNVKFDDFIIPNYEKVKQTVIEQAHNFPHFRLISWDIALDADDNPIIIEANLKYGEIDFHQLNNGPLFGDDTKEILDEVFSSRFKSC